MADDRENPNNTQDQEYTFPDKPKQEFSAAAHSGGTEDILSVVRNPRVLTVVGGLLGVYILISLFSGGDEEEVLEPAAPVAEEQQSIPEEIMSSEPVMESVSLFDDLDDSLEASNKQDEEVDALKRQVESIKRQNADFRVQLKQMDNKIDILTKAVERSSQQISQVIKTQEVKSTDKKEALKQDYKIRAVISGRAWIEDKAGNNITVKVGDTIPTYGRVTKIMPVEGIVETSSGRRITFSHDE